MKRQFRNLKFGDKFTFPGGIRVMQKERGGFAVNSFGPAFRQQIFPGVLVNRIAGEAFTRTARAVHHIRRSAVVEVLTAHGAEVIL